MKERVKYIDFFRFLAIINMVIYHAYYDLRFIFLIDNSVFESKFWYILQQYVCISFIFLSGLSCNYSEKLLKKAQKLLIISILITVVTVLLSKELAIYFGIIHFLTVLTLLLHFIKKINLSNKNNATLFFIFMGLFILFKSKLLFTIPFYGKFYIIMTKLPFSFVIGFPKNSFYSSDYFPILPWIFLGLAGYYFFGTSMAKKMEEAFKNVKMPKIITLISQKSLLIYILHQVIILVVLFIYFLPILRFVLGFFDFIV
jgi:brp/blh family beta-carotene 15,15'-monooxygenase